MARVDRDAPVRFLRTVFEPTDWVAIFLKSYDRSRRGPTCRTRVVGPERTVSTVAAGDERPEYNVFVSVNAIASGRRSRTRDAIGAVRHVFLDADHDGHAVLARVEARRDLPRPSYILHSSPNHIHVFWRVSGFDRDVGRAAAEAARPRVADGSRSHAGDAEHPAAGVLQSQARPAASRDDRVPQRRRLLRAGDFPPSRKRIAWPQSVGPQRAFELRCCRPSSGQGGIWRRCRPRLPASTATSIRSASAAGSHEGSRWTTTRPSRAVANGTRAASRRGPRPSCSTSSDALLGTAASQSAGCFVIRPAASESRQRRPLSGFLQIPAFIGVRRRISPSLRMRS